MLDKLIEIWPLITAFFTVLAAMWGWSLKLLWGISKSTQSITDTLTTHTKLHTEHKEAFTEITNKHEALKSGVHKLETHIAVLQAHDTHGPVIRG